jgi:Na+/H+ antiporter NhaD/arsenite permease-like protein
MARYKGWLAFLLAVVLVLVVLAFVLQVIILLIPVAIIAAIILWLLGLLARKRHKPVVRVFVKKF